VAAHRFGIDELMLRLVVEVLWDRLVWVRIWNIKTLRDA